MELREKEMKHNALGVLVSAPESAILLSEAASLLKITMSEAWFIYEELKRDQMCNVVEYGDKTQVLRKYRGVQAYQDKHYLG